MKTFKEKILDELEGVPEDKMPRLYRMIHLFVSELMSKAKKAGTRGSLKGIWKGSQMDESLFLQARKSLFPYSYK